MAKRALLSGATRLLACGATFAAYGCIEKDSRTDAGDAGSDDGHEYDCPDVGDVPVFANPVPAFPEPDPYLIIEEPGTVTAMLHSTESFTISIELHPSGEPPLPVTFEISRVGESLPDLEVGDEVEVTVHQGGSVPIGVFQRLAINRDGSTVLYVLTTMNRPNVNYEPSLPMEIEFYGGLCEPFDNSCALFDTMGISATCAATLESLDVFSGNVGSIECEGPCTIAVAGITGVIEVHEGCMNDSISSASYMIQRDSECVAGMRYGFLAGCGRAEGTCMDEWEATCSIENSFEFCGCDGVGFESHCEFPDRAYAYPGECIGGITDSTPPCGEDDECEASELCAFGPGCTEPERFCAVNTCGDAIGIENCGCNGETFASGCVAMDRPYAHGGPCDDSSAEGDAPADAPDDGEPSDIPDVP